MKKLVLMMKHLLLVRAVFTIAEIGGNHEGDFEYAKDLVRQATLLK